MPDSVFSGLQILSIGAAIILVTRLVYSGLWREYRWFVFYLSVSTLRDVILAALPLRRSVYGRVWAVSEPLMWMGGILVVLELYRHTFMGFPGIERTGRWFLIGSAALSMAASAAVVAIQNAGGTDPFPILAFVLLAGQVVNLGLACFLLLLLVFLTYYPVPMKRNAVMHAFIFGTYFLGSTAASMVRTTLGPGGLVVANLVAALLAIGCLIGWLAGLNSAGEVRSVALGSRLHPSEERMVIEKLNSLNQILARAGRD
jgi:hypothetical protein